MVGIDNETVILFGRGIVRVHGGSHYRYRCKTLLVVVRGGGKLRVCYVTGVLYISSRQGV